MRKRFRSVFAPMVTMLMLVQSLMPGVWAQNEQYVIRHDAIKAWETAIENRAEDDATSNDEITPDLNGDEDSGTGEGDAGEGTGSGDEPVTQPQAPFVIPPTPVELKELQLIAVQATCAVPAGLDLQPLREREGIKKVELEPGDIVAAGNTITVKVEFADNYTLDSVTSHHSWTTDNGGYTAKTLVVFDAAPADDVCNPDGGGDGDGEDGNAEDDDESDLGDSEDAENDDASNGEDSEGQDENKEELSLVVLLAPFVAVEVCDVEEGAELIVLSNVVDGQVVTEGVAIEEIDGDIVAGNEVIVRVAFEDGYTLDPTSEDWRLGEDGTASITVTVPECEQQRQQQRMGGREIDGRITNVIVEINRQPATAPYALGNIDDRVDFTFSYRAQAPETDPSYVHEGDYFLFTIANYEALGIGPETIELVGCGSTCGTFTIDAAGNARIEFNENVDTSTQQGAQYIEGEVWFWASEGWARDVWGNEEIDLDLSPNPGPGVVITIPAAPAPEPVLPGTEPLKQGRFTKKDEGRQVAQGAIEWTILAPTGPSNGVVLTDIIPVDAGWRFDCNSIAYIDGDEESIDVECNANADLTITIDAYGVGERPGIRILADLDATNPLPAEAKSFSNDLSAEIEDWEGEAVEGQSVSATVTQHPNGEEPGDREPSKSASWNPNSELGQGTEPGREEPVVNAIIWTVRAPAGPANGVTLTDTAPAGTRFECGEDNAGVDILNSGWGAGQANHIRTICSETEITVEFGEYIEWDGSDAPGFRVMGTITDPQSPDPRVMLSYTNTVTADLIPWNGDTAVRSTAEATISQTAPAVPNTNPNKWGVWNTRDRGEIRPLGAITWHIQLPVGPNSKIVLTDLATPHEGGTQWVFNCSPDSLVQVSGPGSVAENVACTETSLVITYENGYGDGEQPYFTIDVDITEEFGFFDGRYITNTATTVVTDYLIDDSDQWDTGEGSSTASVWQESGRGGTGRIGEYAVSVGDYVWFDENKNGIQDDGEPPVPNTIVNLYLASDTSTSIDTTTTNAQGYYWFTGLDSDQRYTIEFIAPTGEGVPDFVGFTYPSKGDGTNDSRVVERESTTGSVTFRAPTMGFNRPSENGNGAGVTDNPNLDAGFVVITDWGDLDEILPVTPTITGNVCTGGEFTPAGVSVGNGSEGITYSNLVANPATSTFTATATLNFSYIWSSNLGDGWIRDNGNPQVAHFSASYTPMPCIPTVPALPDIDFNTCDDWFFNDPEITFEDDNGVAYSEPQITRSGNTFTITVIATVVDGTSEAQGYSWNEDEWPTEYWERTSAATATYTLEVDQHECATVAELPTITWDYCRNGVYTDVASIIFTDIDGRITYTEVEFGGGIITATATLQGNNGWDADLMPDEWTIDEANSQVAHYESTYEQQLCTPRIPNVPVLQGNICTGGVFTAPSINTGSTTGVTYTTDIVWDEDSLTGEYTVTATLANGYEWNVDGGNWPDDWQRDDTNLAVATYTGTFTPMPCIPTVPVSPDIDFNVCEDWFFEDPEVTFSDGAGVTYSTPQITRNGNSFTITVIATVVDGTADARGYSWNVGEWPSEFWQQTGSATATYSRTIGQDGCATLPMLPTITWDYCRNGVYTDVESVIFTNIAGRITYSDVDFGGGIITAIATLDTDRGWDAGLMPEEWTIDEDDPQVAHYESTYDQALCIPTIPVVPQLTGNVCTGGVDFAPDVSFGSSQSGVTYGSTLNQNGDSYAITATLADGYEWNDADTNAWPEDWAVDNANRALARFTLDFTPMPCIATAPVIPQIDVDKCAGFIYVEAKVYEDVTSTGVTYSDVQIVRNANGTYTVTATATVIDGTPSAQGYKWADEADFPENWSRLNNATATYEYTFNESDCATVTAELPAIQGNVCQGGTVQPPSVSFTSTERVTYSDVVFSNGTISATASLAPGYGWDIEALPSVWSVNPAGDPRVATFTGTYSEVKCNPVVPAVEPTIIGNSCQNGVFTTPTASFSGPDGVTYGPVTVTPFGPGAYYLTATASIQNGYAWGSPMPTGWTQQGLTSAAFSGLLEANPCVPTAPVAPAIQGNVCENGAYTPPSITDPTTAGIEYTNVNLSGLVDGQYTITATATITEGGIAWPAQMPEHWTRDSATVASYNRTIDEVPCVPVVPVAPILSGNVCLNGVYQMPSASAANGPAGIAYSDVSVSGPANGEVIVSATATITASGIEWPEQMPLFWDRVSATEAHYQQTYGENSCEVVVPVAPGFNGNVCTGGAFVPPTLVPVTTNGLQYSNVSISGPSAGSYTILASATLENGFAWDTFPDGSGWTRLNATSAFYIGVFPAEPCVPTAPVAPAIQGNVCENGVYTLPSITDPETAGIEYTDVNLSALVDGQYTITAKATITENGISWPATMAEYWTWASATEATYSRTIDEAPCVPVVPVAPILSGNVCLSGVYQMPSASAASGPAGIMYSHVNVDGPVDGEVTITATATITASGIEWETPLPQYWTWDSETVATYERTIDEDPCGVVVPVAPTIDGNVCTGGAFVPPTPVPAETDGVQYTNVRITGPSAGWYSITASATVDPGFTWGTFPANTGWTWLNTTSAFYISTFAAEPCDPIVPAVVTVGEAVCTGGQYNLPPVDYANAPEGVTYSTPVVENGTVTMSATITANGIAWDVANLPEGWNTTDDPAVILFSEDYEPNLCIDRIPVIPTIVGNMCEGGFYTWPSISTVPGTPGVTYNQPGSIDAADGTFSITATLADGYAWNTASDGWDNRWIVTDGNPAEATFTDEFTPAPCDPIPPAVPSIDGNMCTGGFYTLPTVVFSEDTEGVTYEGSAADGTFTATATITANGIAWGDLTGTGWETTDDPAVITYEAEYDEDLCDPITPVELPTIEGNRCISGVYIDPTVTFGDGTDGVSYVGTAGNGVVIATATITDPGIAWGTPLPEGWSSTNNPAVIAYSGTYEEVECILVPAVVPLLTGNFCASGAFIDPDFDFGDDVDGVGYTWELDSRNSRFFIVTATLEDDYAWDRENMPRGWIIPVSNPGVATFRVNNNPAPCVPIPPVVPTIENNECIGGVYIAPTVNFGSGTTGVTYEGSASNGTFIATATITANGIAWGTPLPQGWSTTDDPAVITYEGVYDENLCEEIVPVLPAIGIAVCEGGVYTPPGVTIDDDQEGLTYGTPQVGNGDISIIATVADGFAWGTPLPEGWRATENPTVVVFEAEYDENLCIDRIPVIPTIVGNVCEGGFYTPPSISTVPGTPGVTYNQPGSIDSVTGTFSITATLADGYAWNTASDDWDDRWVVTDGNSAEATFTGEFTPEPCEPVIPVIPQVEGNVCIGGVYVDVNVTFGEGTEGVNYSWEIDPRSGRFIAVTAVLEDGYAWDSENMPARWTVNPGNPAEASYARIPYRYVPCEPVEPVVPIIEGNVCEGGFYTLPTVAFGEGTEGVSYQGSAANGTFTATATITADGIAWGDLTGTGWESTGNPAVITYTDEYEEGLCEQTLPVIPTIVGNVCEGGFYTPPSISTAPGTSGVTYNLPGTIDAADVTFSITATLADGYAWNTASDGWDNRWIVTDGNPAEATFTDEFTPEPCDPVILNLPTVTGNVCVSGAYTPPSVSFGDEIEGVTLSNVTIGGGVITADARLADGFEWNTESADWPTGWKVDEENLARASYTGTYIEAPCAPVVTVNPVIEQAVCAGGVVGLPSVTTVDTDRVSYQIVGDVSNGGTVTVIATLADGYEWDWDSELWLEGWFVNPENLAEATLEVGFDTVECEPVVPVVPTIQGNVCEAGVYLPPTAEANGPEGVVYTTLTAADGAIVAVAVVEDGYGWDAANMPEGWTVDPQDPARATFSGTYDEAPCVSVVPEAPIVTPAVCEVGNVVPPSVELPTTPGVTYTKEGEVVPGGKVTITATLEDGYEWGELPEGWTLVDSTTATFEVTFPSAPDCDPDATPGPDKPIVVTELPTTGAGNHSNGVSLILASLAGLMLAAVALRMNAYKRF